MLCSNHQELGAAKLFIYREVMTLSHCYTVCSRTIFVLFIALGTWAQTSRHAIADYVPPGGDPPPGRTSTSGMRF